MARTELPLLTDLIVLNKCKKIVEVGVAAGEATVYLCKGALETGGHVWGFDIWSAHGLRGQFNRWSSCRKTTRLIIDSGIPSETFSLTRIDTRGERERFEALLEEHCAPIDFAFIDGCHSYVGVQNDFFAIYKYLSPTGIIVFHDTYVIDGCREFVLDLRTKYFDGTFDIVDFPFGYGDRCVGISVLVKRSYHKVGRPMDEICNLDDRREQIELREREWYICQEELYGKSVSKPNLA